MANETAKVAEPISGDKLYQLRGRQAFPLLVRQAKAGTPIFYSNLAQEMGMSNPRTLNYPLGSIGHTLNNLKKVWKEDIPPLQCLVVNKGDGVPGEGIAWFLRKLGDFSSLPKRSKRELVAGAHAMIYAYQYWDDVLEYLDLPATSTDFKTIIKRATRGSLGGGGESDEHRALKEFVAKHPDSIGLSKQLQEGQMEYDLPSGDALDVSFYKGSDWTAAEVKSSRSSREDIVRGMYQCVKYKAVMEAKQIAMGWEKSARSILVLGAPMPDDLIPLKNILGIELIANVIANKG